MSVILNIEAVEQLANEQKDLLQAAAELTVYSVEHFARFLMDNEFNAVIDLSFYSEDSIRELNFTQRGIDRATDVLSFPLLHFKEGQLMEELSAALFLDPSAEYPSILLGDLVIALPVAEKQASAYGHSLERELAFLTVHGILHLLGFDHQDEAEELRMRKLQRRVMNELKLERGGGDE